MAAPRACLLAPHRCWLLAYRPCNHGQPPLNQPTHACVHSEPCRPCCLQEYKPAKLAIGRPHPDPVVETASLAAVEPPDITYEPAVRCRCCCV